MNPRLFLQYHQLGVSAPPLVNAEAHDSALLFQCSAISLRGVRPSCYNMESGVTEAHMQAVSVVLPHSD